VMCMSQSTALVGLGLPMVAMGIPIFDTLFVMMRRFLERRSIFAPDQSHLHHHLLALGLRHRHAVLAIYGVTLLITGAAVPMIFLDDFRSLLVFGGVLTLIVLLFRAVGVVRLREILAGLQEKHARASRQRHERQTFEHLQLRFRQAHDAGQAWAAVCEASHRMGFAWVRLRAWGPDGWITEEAFPCPPLPPDPTCTVTMTIPLAHNGTGARRQLEIAMDGVGTIESAGRRATFFGRLIDESAVPAILSS